MIKEAEKIARRTISNNKIVTGKNGEIWTQKSKTDRTENLRN